MGIELNPARVLAGHPFLDAIRIQVKYLTKIELVELYAVVSAEMDRRAKMHPKGERRYRTDA